ncbi:class I mannose-6-phosphate isomerase [Sphingobium sp. Z007]|uniref:class I mannose-6-phosphate isomerase n=1 Tax=Sphingobium sp. Z007 TaxID=627495 RepID=UPI000B4A3C14|nr:class I mannose-6-phosphate isomerase [Sphingobium sp. Z007]
MPKLHRHYVSKPWGSEHIPPAFDARCGGRIGEIWFQEMPDRGLPLLVKYIFTTERLSIQVHPNDEQARAIGQAQGKSECWYILDCVPDAVIGIGFKAPISEADFRASISDGSIVDLMHWQSVKQGDFFFIPAGTVHAIGAGIILAEIQQNSDITYRLFDYGRPRELHVEAGAAVSRLGTYEGPSTHAGIDADKSLFNVSGAPFTVFKRLFIVGEEPHWPQAALFWFLPLSGSGLVDGQAFSAGECWLLSGEPDMELLEDCAALVATV